MLLSSPLQSDNSMLDAAERDLEGMLDTSRVLRAAVVQNLDCAMTSWAALSRTQPEARSYAFLQGQPSRSKLRLMTRLQHVKIHWKATSIRVQSLSWSSKSLFITRCGTVLHTSEATTCIIDYDICMPWRHVHRATGTQRQHFQSSKAAKM